MSQKQTQLPLSIDSTSVVPKQRRSFDQSHGRHLPRKRSSVETHNSEVVLGQLSPGGSHSNLSSNVSRMKCKVGSYSHGDLASLGRSSSLKGRPAPNSGSLAGLNLTREQFSPSRISSTHSPPSVRRERSIRMQFIKQGESATPLSPITNSKSLSAINRKGSHQKDENVDLIESINEIEGANKNESPITKPSNHYNSSLEIRQIKSTGTLDGGLRSPSSLSSSVSFSHRSRRQMTTDFEDISLGSDSHKQQQPQPQQQQQQQPQQQQQRNSPLNLRRTQSSNVRTSSYENLNSSTNSTTSLNSNSVNDNNNININNNNNNNNNNNSNNNKNEQNDSPKSQSSPRNTPPQKGKSQMSASISDFFSSPSDNFFGSAPDISNLTSIFNFTPEKVRKSDEKEQERPNTPSSNTSQSVLNKTVSTSSSSSPSSSTVSLAPSQSVDKNRPTSKEMAMTMTKQQMQDALKKRSFVVKEKHRKNGEIVDVTRLICISTNGFSRIDPSNGKLVSNLKLKSVSNWTARKKDIFELKVTATDRIYSCIYEDAAEIADCLERMILSMAILGK